MSERGSALAGAARDPRMPAITAAAQRARIPFLYRVSLAAIAAALPGGDHELDAPVLGAACRRAVVGDRNALTVAPGREAVARDAALDEIDLDRLGALLRELEVDRVGALAVGVPLDLDLDRGVVAQ